MKILNMGGRVVKIIKKALELRRNYENIELGGNVQFFHNLVQFTGNS